MTEFHFDAAGSVCRRAQPQTLHLVFVLHHHWMRLHPGVGIFPTSTQVRAIDISLTPEWSMSSLVSMFVRAVDVAATLISNACTGCFHL